MSIVTNDPFTFDPEVSSAVPASPSGELAGELAGAPASPAAGPLSADSTSDPQRTVFSCWRPRQVPLI